jgi:hypothetical protein
MPCIISQARHTSFPQRAGKLMKEWKLTLLDDPTANMVVATTGSKRKAVCVRFTGFWI